MNMLELLKSIITEIYSTDSTAAVAFSLVNTEVSSITNKMWTAAVNAPSIK
ncbi:unnamed protein product, partial [Rotaria sordida]